MTYISKYICDKCKKEIDSKKDGVFSLHILEDIHLCRKCYEDIKKIIIKLLKENNG